MQPTPFPDDIGDSATSDTRPAGVGTCELTCIWPGHWYPLGATFDGVGCNFSALLGSRDTRRVVPVRRRRAPSGGSICPRRGPSAGTATCPGIAPGQRYGYRVHGPWDPGTRPALQSGQAAARSVRQGDRGRGHVGTGGVPVSHRRRWRPRRRSRRARSTARRSVPRSIVVGHDVRLGRRPADAPAAAPDRDLRAARQGIHRAHAGCPARDSRHLRRPRPSGVDRLPDAARRQRGRADARASVRARRASRRPRPAQLLGLQLDRLLRAAQRLLERRAARRAGARVQGDGQGAARRRHRSDPRRRLQPHRRGQSRGAGAVVQGPRQLRLLPDGRRRRRATTWTTPGPATA